MPPSPMALSVFKGCKLKHPVIPNEPTFWLLCSARTAWAQSSTICNPYLLLISIKRDMFEGLPVKWTGKIAFVFSEIFSSIFMGSILKSSPTSTKTGFAVPELTPMAYLVPHNSANLFSNFSTSSPRIKLPLLIILEIFCITSSWTIEFSEATSTYGTSIFPELIKRTLFYMKICSLRKNNFPSNEINMFGLGQTRGWV